MKNQKKHSLSELTQIYKESKECDQEVFAEQRSNILLVSGNHYNKKHSQVLDRIRAAPNLTTDQKLRLTKNHIYKISKVRKNLILTHAPGVTILPTIENDNQCQKSAELNNSVVQFAKVQQNMKAKTQQFASDYFDIGEVAAKVWWNPTGGAFKGYNQATDDITGEPVFDEMGQPMADKSDPVFEGCLEIERLFAFNLWRNPSAKSMDESDYWGIDKVAKVSDLQMMFPEDDERHEKLKEGRDQTYLIFDANKQGYAREKGITTVKEIYFRPSPQYPMGFYYIFTDEVELFSGELPFGIWPLAYEGHDENPTSARHRSPIKQLRPYQIEINRASSAQAETQVTMGMDKIIMQAGAKLTPGEVLPGLRAYHATGRDPTILEGRTGQQYTEYIAANISEMYQTAMVPEEMENKSEGDAWAELFKSMKQKKKFVMDAEKFEMFLSRVWSIYLDLARNYFPDDMLIPMIGKSEIVNISEFRNTDKLSYRIKAEPMSDDMYSVMGKTLMINHILQFSSGQLDQESIGKLIRLMPFANGEKTFEDFTLNYDRAENIILALDRGEAPQPIQGDDGAYIIKKLSARMSKADFAFLHQQIQQNYSNMVQLYTEINVENARKLKAMEADFIPTDGPMIKVAWYIKDPSNPSRSIQATLPANSINWLVQRLSDQQGFKAPLEGIPEGIQAQMADQYVQGQQQSGAPGIGMPQNGGMIQ